MRDFAGGIWVSAASHHSSELLPQALLGIQQFTVNSFSYSTAKSTTHAKCNSIQFRKIYPESIQQVPLSLPVLAVIAIKIIYLRSSIKSRNRKLFSKLPRTRCTSNQEVSVASNECLKAKSS
jgi:hypothetical protein